MKQWGPFIYYSLIRQIKVPVDSIIKGNIQNHTSE